MPVWICWMRLRGIREPIQLIAELSLSPLFPRSYNSIYKAIIASFNTTSQEMKNEEQEGGKEEEEKPNNLIRAVSELIKQPQQRPFYLFAIDTTTASASLREDFS